MYALLGRTAYGADGDRLGTVSGAYLDNETGQPSWITVERGGLFRTTTHSFVPLEGAEVVDDGVRVAVDGDAVKRAPHVEGDRVLSAADERGLRAHYGLDQPGPAEPGQPTTAPEPELGTTAAAEQDAMTRSEERARVGTTRVPASRAVLRKTRVVEDRTFSVPLGRDQVQVAYEPLPDGARHPLRGMRRRGRRRSRPRHTSRAGRGRTPTTRAGSSSTRSGSSSAPNGCRWSGCGWGWSASRARRSCRSTCVASASTSTWSTPGRTGHSLSRWLSSVPATARPPPGRRRQQRLHPRPGPRSGGWPSSGFWR